MIPAIELDGLVKHFGDTRAVDGVDLSITPGTVYGVDLSTHPAPSTALLGPNGAGKTTIIRILATLLRPSSGVTRILGHDVACDATTVRSKVSLTGQFASVDEDLTGHENLVLVAHLFGHHWKGARSRADDITKGLFDRFRSVPIWQSAPIVGALLGDVLRYSIAASMVVGLGLILGFRPAAGPVGVVLAVALIITFAFSLSWIWIIVGMLVKTPESVMTSSFLLLFPLTFASNIFVDPATMPGWLQRVVQVNPVTHLTTASRGLMHGGVSATSVLWVLVASALITAVFAPVALRMYHRER